ncbi:MAG: hypothetical protein Kow0069_34080 [Promethearchaeota archaeon]
MNVTKPIPGKDDRRAAGVYSERTGGTLFNPAGLVPRDYQVSLAELCSRSDHLVVLPTGLGKTLVAAMVAGRVLKSAGAGSKVVVLAPTKPLVAQHLSSFHKHLDLPADSLKLLTGEVTPERRAREFLAATVAFMTPETLRNDLDAGRYDLKNVSLVVFDEAHHARGDYAYCPVARRFKDDNPSGLALGLTASPGNSQDQVAEVLRNLRVPAGNVLALDRDDESVKRHVKRTRVERIVVDLPSQYVKVLRVLREFEAEYEATFGRLCEMDCELDPKDYANAGRRVKLLKVFQRRLSGNPSDPVPYKAVKVLGNLLRVGHYVDVVETQGLDVFVQTLARHFQEARKPSAAKGLREFVAHPRAGRLLNYLVQLGSVDPDSLVHPKIKVLREVLSEALGRAPEIRALVFAKLRDTVQLLQRAVVDLPGVRVSRFVGQSSKGKGRSLDRGMSQKSQLETLEKFRRGDLNVLVATNVAEEGLDVVECDLVVMYDVVDSEVRMIQREGRTARHRAGRVVLLLTRGTKDELNYHVQRRKRRSMRETLAGGREVDARPRNNDARPEGGVKRAAFRSSGEAKEGRRAGTESLGRFLNAREERELQGRLREGEPSKTNAAPEVVVTPLKALPWRMSRRIGAELAPFPVRVAKCEGDLEVRGIGGETVMVVAFTGLDAITLGDQDWRVEDLREWASRNSNRGALVLVVAVENKALPPDPVERTGVIDDLQARLSPAKLLVVDEPRVFYVLVRNVLNNVVGEVR